VPGPAQLVTLVDGEASIVIDARLWPIVIATWFGRPSETLVEQYFTAHDRYLQRARDERGKLVLITDTFATERPSPVARKRIVELTKMQAPDTRSLTLESYIVIENAVIRGVVTALAWVYPQMSESQNVASLGVALERARLSLMEAGLRPPVDLVASAYARPARPTAA
jgi:hypothetical protein